MHLPRPALLLSGICLIALTDCGGGGGDGGGGAAPSTGASNTASLVSTPQNAAETTSFWLHDGSGGIDALGAIHAGYIGTGETAAIIDSGVADISAFSGRLQSGYDAFTSQTFAAAGSYDDNGHGTFVAGIMAAADSGTGVVGVAPGGNIVPVEVIDSNGYVGGEFATQTTIDGIIASAQNWVTAQGVKVENNSWGIEATLPEIGSVATIASGTAALEADEPNAIAAWESYVAAGGVAVWAAGNIATSEPDANSELALGIPSLQPGWIVAVGLTQAGTLDSRFAACGPAAAYCVAAPADNIIGLTTTGGLATGSGTSFATPQVTGLLLDLLARFPNLTAQQARDIIFQTANKSGIYADSAIYGQGLINVDAALSPIGGVTVSTSQGVIASLAQSQVELGAAFGNGLSTALAATDVIVRDSWNRGFAASAGGLIAGGSSLPDEESRVASFGEEAGTVVANGPVSLQFAGTTEPDPARMGGVRTDLYAVSYRAPGGYAMGVSYNVPASRAYTSQNAEALDAGLILPSGVSDPYLALIGHAMTASVGLPAMDGIVTFGMVAGRSPEDRWDNPFVAQSALSDLADSAVNIAYATRIGRNSSLTVEGGEMVEAHGLLGSGGTGVGTLGSATTFHGGVVGQFDLGNRVTFSAGLHIGETSGHGGQDSIIGNISSVMTTAGGIGATIASAFRPGDRFDLAAGMPLKAQTGEAAVTLPTAEDSNGLSIYQTIQAPVRATAQEFDFQGSWMAPLGAISKIGLAATLRANPNNVSGAAPEGILAVRYATRF